MVSLAVLVGGCVNCVSHGTELQLHLSTHVLPAQLLCQPWLCFLCAVPLADIGCMFGSGTVWPLALCSSVVCEFWFCCLLSFHISEDCGCYRCFWPSLGLPLKIKRCWSRLFQKSEQQQWPSVLKFSCLSTVFPCLVLVKRSVNL